MQVLLQHDLPTEAQLLLQAPQLGSALVMVSQPSPFFD
jgi:hypothetical protein